MCYKSTGTLISILLRLGLCAGYPCSTNTCFPIHAVDDLVVGDACIQ
jgi:hypothetical protein